MRSDPKRENTKKKNSLNPFDHDKILVHSDDIRFLMYTFN